MPSALPVPNLVDAAKRRSAQQSWVFSTSLVIVAVAALYLVGNWNVSLWDRDEAWYAQTSRQMVQSGDWIVPKFLDEVRYAKPIFIYWCQATSMKVFGQTPFAARLVSAVAMTLTLIVLAAVLRKAVGPRRAMYTVLIFATSAIVIASAKMCLTDSVMLLFITVGQLCLFAIYRARMSDQAPERRSDEGIVGTADRNVRPTGAEDRGWRIEDSAGAPHADRNVRPTEDESQISNRKSQIAVLLLWLCIGLAGLTKGPVVLILFASTLLVLAAFDRGPGWRSWSAWKRGIAWWPTLRPLMGLFIIVAVVAPWLVAAWFKNREFLVNLLLEPLRHTTSNQSGQFIYPGYYLLSIWLTFFPWSLFLPLALGLAWKHRRTPHVRFALSIVLGNWIYVEIMVTKLPHYMLPSYAALAFLAATALIRCIRRQHGNLHRPRALVAASAWTAGAMLLALVPLWPALRFKGVPIAAAQAFAIVGVAYALSVFICLFRGRIATAAGIMGAGMMVVIAILYGWYLPSATYLRIPQLAGEELRELGATGPGQVVMTGYAEPSLAFYQGGTIRPREDDWLLDSDPATWPTWIVTTRAMLDQLPLEKRSRLELIDSVCGINYNTGFNSVELTILRTKSNP